MEFGLTENIIYSLVNREIVHAIEKHGDGIPATRYDFLSILTEEVGEIAKSLNKKESSDRLRSEVVQVIAVCQMYLTGTLRDSPK